MRPGGVAVTQDAVAVGGEFTYRFRAEQVGTYWYHSHQVSHEQVQRGLFGGVVTGDWAKKRDTGGVFMVEDAELEAPRALGGDISATLPLYGKKVRVSSLEAGALELETLTHFGLTWADFTARKGSRRPSRIFLEDVSLTPEPDGFALAFTLQKGSFATSVLREVTKTEVDEPLTDGEDDEA